MSELFLQDRRQKKFALITREVKALKQILKVTADVKRQARLPMPAAVVAKQAVAAALPPAPVVQPVIATVVAAALAAPAAQPAIQAAKT